MENRKMTDVKKFTDADMLKLAEAYRDNKVLWQITDKSYRNRKARDEAYIKIRDTLNLPSLKTKKEVARKIKNLRSSYLQELKKIDKSIKCGAAAVYKPKMSWFQIADKFMKYSLRQRVIPLERDNDTENSLDIGNESEKLIPKQLSECSLQTDAHNGYSQNKHILERHSKKPFKKTRLRDSNSDIITSVLDKLNEIRKVKTEPDECEAFAKYVGFSLRKMPPKYFVTAKALIQQTLTDIELRVIEDNTMVQGHNIKKKEYQ